MSEAEPEHLDVPGAILHVVRVGRDALPPLVVLHGGPGEAHDVLRPHLDALSALRQVVYYDQRGGGRSPLTEDEPGGFREHVADLERVRAHLGAERVDVLGFSWGALLAMLHALDHPDAVARMVLVSPSVPEGPSIDGAPPPSDFAERVGPVLFDRETLKVLTPVALSPDAASAAMRSLSDAGLPERLPRLRSKRSLLVHGENDPVSAPRAPALAEVLGARRVVLPRCGHAPFAEAHAPFVDAVARFLSEAP